MTKKTERALATIEETKLKLANEIVVSTFLIYGEKYKPAREMTVRALCKAYSYETLASQNERLAIQIIAMGFMAGCVASMLGEETGNKFLDGSRIGSLAVSKNN
jgi:hypothetical protein